MWIYLRRILILDLKTYREMSRILVVVQWEIKVDQVLCCSFNANGAIWHYIGKGLEPVFWSRGSTAEHTKHTLKHTASVDFTPVDFANTEQALFRWILHQWILQIHSTHYFIGFWTSGFCKYTAHTASFDFAPVDFANTEQALLRWILHQWILQIHSTHCFVGFCTAFCSRPVAAITHTA